jgi:Mrp family chromosome partitioning ATPase
MTALVTTSGLEARAIQDLITRIDASFPPGRGRVIGFLASGSGEGTSTVAQTYARSVATHLRRRVLLVDAAGASTTPPQGGMGSLVGVLTALAVQVANTPPSRGAAPGTFVPGVPEGTTLWELLPRADLWIALRQSYDEVIIDLPAAAESRLGLAVAPYCDGIAVVIEAERTRAPVAENLVSHLRTVRARVLGAVMNRRRFHLPQRVYRLL